MKNDVSVGEIVIGNARVKFELPTSLFNIISSHAKSNDNLKLYSYHVDTIIDIIRPMIPDEKRPPTHKQEHYARSISEALNIELSAEVLTSTSACSEFLDQYSEEYKSLVALQKAHLQKNRECISQATRVNRWLSSREALENGASLEKVAEDLGVKPPTIAKYCAQLEAWEAIAQTDDSYTTVMGLVKRQRQGENIYESY
jgi:hypothetical protein